jgi:hypothetical protein
VGEIGEVPGFGNGRPEGSRLGCEGEGWRGMDEVGKLGEDESDSEDKQRGLKGCGHSTGGGGREGRVSESFLNRLNECRRTGRIKLTSPRCFQLNLISTLVLALSR